MLCYAYLLRERVCRSDNGCNNAIFVLRNMIEYFNERGILTMLQNIIIIKVITMD